MLAENKSLTGKVLVRCPTVADLKQYGIHNETIAEIVWEDYLQKWKVEGVPMRMLTPREVEVDF